MNPIQHRAGRGFSLIEVMIAVVILSFGLLALAAFQGTLMRAGAEAKARATATALAQQIIEEGRSFAHVSKPTVTYAGATYVDSLVGFAGKTISSGGVNYTVDRTVTRYSPTGAPIVAAFDPATPEFKLVTVDVSWTGSDGDTKTVTLDDTVAAIAPADSMNVVRGPLDLASGPQVWIEPPNKDNPAVVPIAVGDDKSAASSNPVPRRFTKVDSNTAATLFSVHTFTGSTAGDEVLLNRKLDVAGVTCRCSTGSATKSTATNPAYEPTVWNGKQLAYMEPTPLPTGTKIGLFEDKGSSSRDIEAMCDTCCRDHHESAKREQRPDPHRALTSAEAGGAEHYLYTNLTTPISSGVYSEACQLVRVGGRMRITIDPKQNFLLSVPLNATATGHEPANFVTRYSDLVVQYLKDGVGALPSGYLSPTAPFPAFVGNTYAPDCATNPTAGYCDILEPAPIYLAPGTAKQLVSFGLYVDYINDDTMTAYKCAGSTSTSDTECNGLRERNPLETLPFYAINVANLGIWTVDTNGQEWLTVSSPQYDTKGILIGDGGAVTASTTKTSANPFNCGFVNLDVTRSSSGVAGRLPIDPHDNSAGNKTREVLAFTSKSGTTACK